MDYCQNRVEAADKRWAARLEASLAVRSPFFTGKERDAETGLDYFGARYLSAAQGRFTSPDPLLNSGRPEIPQSWNRYAYTLNNPLKYVDPDGLYEWSVSCDEKNDAACHQNRQWFRDALADVRVALKKADPESQEYKDLKRVSDYYGNENKPTGISVAFKADLGPGPGNSTSQLVTFDIKFITKTATDWKNAGYPVDVGVESAAVVAHEGSNAFDRIGRFSREDYPRIFRDEINAYRTQSDVNYLFNTQSPWGLWNPSWVKVDKVKAAERRNKAIEENARRSTDATFGIKRK